MATGQDWSQQLRPRRSQVFIGIHGYHGTDSYFGSEQFVVRTMSSVRPWARAVLEESATMDVVRACWIMEDLGRRPRIDLLYPAVGPELRETRRIGSWKARESAVRVVACADIAARLADLPHGPPHHEPKKKSFNYQYLQALARCSKDQSFHGHWSFMLKIIFPAL